MSDTLFRRVLVTGAVGALTSAIALAGVARLERRAAAKPFNATSHWLNGDGAARRRRIDLRHTGIGLATHAVATVFWATFYETWLMQQPPRGRAAVGDRATRACAVAALAAAVDYTITPRRFTPGWELVLSKRAMTLAYVAMAAGFVGVSCVAP